MTRRVNNIAVTQTMSIDAQNYPHSIDGIFAAADRPALLALRRACRAWRTRADLALGSHLRITPHPTREDAVCLSAASGRHPALRQWPDPSAERIIAAAEIVDFVGPVRLWVLEHLVLGHPTVRCLPDGGHPFPDAGHTHRNELLDVVSPNGLAPRDARRQLPFEGRYASAVVCSNLRDGLPNPRIATISEVDARRWVSVTTVTGPSVGVCARARVLRRRDEYVWVLRPGGPLPPNTDHYLVNELAAEMVFACRGGAPRFKLVGFDTLPREWWCGQWHEAEERRDGDDEDGVDGALYRLLRARVRWWVDKAEADVRKQEAWYAAVLDNTRILSLDAYRAHLLATPGLGARAVELELGDGALVHR